MLIQGFLCPGSNRHPNDNTARWGRVGNRYSSRLLLIVACPGGDTFEVAVGFSFSLAMAGNWKLALEWATTH
jgi:hypothetical protein